MKKAILIGASSGIGYELAKVFSKNGYELGLTARRLNLLEQLATELPTKSYVQQMDVANTEPARSQLKELIERMGGVDIIIINAGVGDTSYAWENEQHIIQVNVLGFTALCNYSFEYFKENGGGQIVGISSVSAMRGLRLGTVYAASKRFMTHYMEGLRQRAMQKKLPITITDIRPGFVKTPMTEVNENMFWVAPVEKAAKQIFESIEKKQNVAYVTRRWAIVAWLMRNLPAFIWNRV